jgi:hypothetical protein
MISEAASSETEMEQQARDCSGRRCRLRDPKTLQPARLPVNRYPYRWYTRNRHEWNASGRDSPTLILVE